MSFCEIVKNNYPQTSYFFKYFRHIRTFQRRELSTLRLSRGRLSHPYANIDDLSSNVSEMCHHLIERDTQLVYKTQRAPQPGVFTKTDTFYENTSQNCDNFKQKNGFTLEPTSQDEADFPLAFSILTSLRMVKVIF